MHNRHKSFDLSCGNRRRRYKDAYRQADEGHILSKLHESKITVELAMEALKESSTNTQEEIKADDIIKCVCDFYKLDKADLIGKKKNKEFVEPRQICIYLINDLMSLPLVTIGQKMGGRDHTTVIYARDKVAELIKTNPNTARVVNDLKNMILRK